MGSFLDTVRDFIQYTSADAPYRTNPQTGQRYSYGQMELFAQQTSQQYNFNYQTNPYIEPDRPALAVA